MKQKIMKKTINYFRLIIFELSICRCSIRPIAASFCIAACTDVATAPEVNNLDEARILSMFASPGWHSVSQLMDKNDRAICVLGQAGAYSKIDRHGYLPAIEKLKLPWVHGFLAEIGVTTDWYWTLVIFDASNRFRVMKIDRGKTADVSYETTELCFINSDRFFVKIDATTSTSVPTITFQ